MYCKVMNDKTGMRYSPFKDTVQSYAYNLYLNIIIRGRASDNVILNLREQNL